GERGGEKEEGVGGAGAGGAPGPAPRTAQNPPTRPPPVGLGRGFPASEIDWAARLAAANSESSAISIPAGTAAVGTESHAPPQRDAGSPSAALVGVLIFVLLTLWALAARAFLLQHMPSPATTKRAGPPRRGAAQSAWGPGGGAPGGLVRRTVPGSGLPTE